MNIRRPALGALVSLAVVAAVVLLATPYALADGYVVVFSKTDDELTSISYTTSNTGAVVHLLCDLGEGVYRVTQNGSELGEFNCYGPGRTKPDGSPGDNTVQFTSAGGGTFDAVWIAELSGQAPPAPVITTDGGNGPGVDYTTTEPALLLEGTCVSSVVAIMINGSSAGVNYTAGQTTWSYSGTLTEGDNLFAVTGTNGDGLTSPADTITITLAPPTPPPAPEITTDGGNGPGADYVTGEPALLLEGTCDSSLVRIDVNGSSAGVSYTAGQTTWSYSGTLTEGDNVFAVTGTDGNGVTSSADTITITLTSTPPPPAPVITTDGGNGPGAGYTTTEPALLLEGTCDSSTVSIQVNGASAGVSYTAGQTTWSYSGTLTEGDNVFAVTATDGNGLTSPPDTITITLTGAAPPAPVITTDGGNGPGADFTTADPLLVLAGTCDSSTHTIRVNGGSLGVMYTPGDTSWSYGESGAEYAPVAAVAFQNEGTTEADVLSSVSELDDVWSPADIVPFGTVTASFYATGPGDPYFDALSLEFAADGLDDLSDLALRVYLHKGPYEGTWWEHYELLPGTLNPEHQDYWQFTYEPDDPRDYLPNGTLEPDTTVGWVELPFDAVSDPSFIEPNGNIGVTLRMWNWRVDAVRLVQLSGGTVSLNEGPNTFSVTAADASGAESPPDTITVTLDTTPPAAPVVTSDGGNGAGADFVTSAATIVIEGTCDADSAVVKVNGSAADVSYTAGQTTWSYTASLNDGPNTFSVTATDALGNESAADSITITLDRTPPAPPVITTDGGNGVGADFATAAATVALGGTCATDSAEIRVNGSATGVSYTAGQTTWSYTASLNDGPNTFSVTATDALGNESAADSITITLDRTPPAPPVITTDGGNGPGTDFLTNVPALALEGTCDSSTGSILVNGSTAGVTYTAGATVWTYTGTLTEGSNTFTVTAQDRLGNMSGPATIVIELDTVPPPSIRPIPSGP